MSNNDQSLAPAPSQNETLTAFVSRTWAQWHQAALPRAQQHYLAVMSDRVIGTLERGTAALERIAGALEALGPEKK